MAKYGGWFTTQEVCGFECEEAEAILDRYGVTDEDKETITGMIKQAYFLLSDAYAWMNEIEKKPEGMKAAMEVYRDRVREVNKRFGIENWENSQESGNRLRKILKAFKERKKSEK